MRAFARARLSAPLLFAAAAFALFAPFAQADGEASPISGFETVDLGPLERVKINVLAQMMSDASRRPFAVSGNLDTEFSVLVPDGDPMALRPDDLYSFGLSILASAGLSVVDDGHTCRIVRLPEGGGLAVGSKSGEGDCGLVTRVFRLKHASAEDVRRVLEGGSGRKSWITVLDSANLIVVTDTMPTLDRVASLLEELDRPGLARKTEIVKLLYADAEALASQLNLIATQSMQSEGAVVARRISHPDGGAGARAVLQSAVAIPAPKSNAVILVGQESQIAEFKKIAALLDVDTPTGRGSLNVIALQYLKAEDVAKSLSSLLEKSAAKAGADKDIRRIAVEASTVNNAIIVDASPGDFLLVKQLVSTMDKLPGQVHVSVMIAEVTDGDGLLWNPKLTALDSPSRAGQNSFSAGSRLSADTSGIIEGAARAVLPQGITAAISHGGRSQNGEITVSYPGIVSIEALKEESHVNIVSETSLQAQNNIEAEVKIVDDIPYLKSSVEGSGSDRDFIQNVDRMEVGVSLKFTPYIVPGSLVRMSLEPTIASVVSTSDSLNPTIAKRSAKTIVTVPDAETIVIAGLTRTAKKKVQHKIPVLGSIPLLGWLFRYKSDVEEKTNLLIFVTPTIISTPDSALESSLLWQRKTGIAPSMPPSEGK